MEKGTRSTTHSISCLNRYPAGLEYTPNLDIYAQHLKTEKQVLQACISWYTYTLVEPSQEARHNTLIRRWQARIEDIDAQLSVIKKVRR